MPDTVIFSAVPGRKVVVLPADDATTFNLTVTPGSQSKMAGPISGPTSSTGIITGVRSTQRVAAQFQVTLDESLFVVPFGDEAGQMSVTMVQGMMCPPTPTAANPNPSSPGVIDEVNAMLQWYLNNKFQRNNVQPLTLGIGASVFKGYAIGFALDAQAAEGGMVRSQLDLIAWSVQ